MRKKGEKPVVAIDLGGTKIITAVIATDGRTVAEARQPTLAAEGVQAVIDRLFTGIDGILRQNGLKASGLSAVSLAVAGPIDARRGVVTESPNMPDWHDIPLRDMVHDRYGIDAFIVNDASAAALGEQCFGAGKSVKDLVLLTLGTGIGGGIVIDGRLYEGVSGGAGELGHMVIDVNGPECGCGRRGCLEALASGTAVAREAVARLRQGEKSSLMEMAGGSLENVTAALVSEAVRRGDALSRDVFSRAAGYLGVGMANIINIFNPQMIVLGGGMAHLEELFVAPARKTALAQAFTLPAGAVRIVTAGLGEKAGICGAAAYAFSYGR